MTFDQALTKLFAGAKIRREYWHSYENIKRIRKSMTVGSFDISDDDGRSYRPTVDDIFADDWMVVE